MGTPRNSTRKGAAARPHRCITEWIGIFQSEECLGRGADIRNGHAMAHFNIFLARHGGLPAKVSKISCMVNAPIGELNAGHFRDFLVWIAAHPGDFGPEWYAPVLAKFIEWLANNKAIPDGKRREFFSALNTADVEH